MTLPPQDRTYRYDYGLPFTEKLRTAIDSLGLRVRKNKATLIIIDGGVGEGKTTLAVHLADYIQGQEILFDEQLSMGGDDFITKLKVCYQKKLAVVVYDEAGDFNRRGSLTKLNGILNRIFETFRTFKIVVIICLPNFNVLDNQLFDNRIPRLLLHLHGRTRRQGNFSAYSLKRMLWLRHYMTKYKANKHSAYKIVTPNFRGHFLDLTPERSKTLDAYSTKGKFHFLSENAKKAAGLLTYDDLAKKTGRSVPWLRKTVSRLKLQPAKVEKKVRYFNEAILPRIVEQAKYKKGE